MGSDMSSEKLVAAKFPFAWQGRSVSSTAVVLLRENRPVRFFLVPARASDSDSDSSGANIRPGDIYIGKVERVQKNIGAAFVRFQKDQTGYLEDAGGLKAGDEFPVQVVSMAVKTKKTRLSRKLTLNGSFLVLSSGEKGISFSKKLSPEEKERIRQVLAPLITGSDVQVSVLARTRAGTVSDNGLTAEWNALSEEMREISRSGRTRTCFSRIYGGEDLCCGLLRESVPGAFERIVTDLPDVYETLQDYVADHPFMKYPEPVLYDEDAHPPVPLYNLYNLKALFSELTGPNVHLKSGGSLVIEETEAFTAIDVNTGRNQSGKDYAETVRRTNEEAANEIARQIVLRQLSGTILIDFINGPSGTREADEQRLMDQMRKLFESDHDVKVVDFTGLGIMEMTRRKRVRPLSEQLRYLMNESSDNSCVPETRVSRGQLPTASCNGKRETEGESR